MALPSSLAKLEEQLDGQIKEIEAARVEAEETQESEEAQEAEETQASDDQTEPVQEATKAEPEGTPEQEIIKRLEAQNKSLDNDNRSQRIKRGELERRVKELEAENEALKTKAVEPTPQKVSLTDEEKEILEAEGLSEDVLSIIGKVFDRKQDSSGTDEVKKLKQDIGTIKAQAESDRFISELSMNVPNWRAVNVDPNFLKWLENKVPYQSYTFQDRLNAAGQQFDSATVIEIFNAYPGAKAAPKSKSLKDLVEPGSKRTSSPVPKDGKIWKRDEIQKAYTDIATGKISEEEGKKIEAEITAAMAAGRIR